MERKSIAKLRNAVAKLRRRREARGRRYPADLRRRLIAHVVSERAKGVSVRATAAALGLSYPTVLGWLQARPNGFRSVAVKPLAPETGVSTLRLVTA
jgi:transposase-like protein